MFSEIAAIRTGNATRKGTTMTSGPRPRAHDPEEPGTSSGESLDEATERTAEVMDDARKQVDRARETFHDQILAGRHGSEELEYESEPGPKAKPEPDEKGDDTKAAWPNRT